MGKTDTITKAYIEDNTIFADAFNFAAYDGRPIIKPEQLHILNNESAITPYSKEGHILPIDRLRDVIKYYSIKYDERAFYMILGIENQHHVHYAMPVRNMLYDALKYAEQIKYIETSHKKSKDSKGHNHGEFLSGFYKSDKLMPVITLVILFSPDEWDGPKSLHEMLAIHDEGLKALIANYKINLIAPASIEDTDFDKFNTTLNL